jgi:hypothetical protein
MQPTRTIGHTGEITRVERSHLHEAEHAVIHLWSRQFHEVIPQRIAAAAIGMQEAARQIEPGGGKRLAGLPFENSKA